MDAFDDRIGCENLVGSGVWHLRHCTVIARSGSKKRMAAELRSQVPDGFELADFAKFFHVRMINVSSDGNNPLQKKTLYAKG
jgi:hypothetical protein